ncbi:hypothetical protein AAF712_008690 [Marasmius tenuissimus]|uniref:Uncharacterized protein n=1 Tax=Marasmius tenuissimus TaxID=585030 RepID=A0ABR2ZST6_9AGAR
MGRALFSQSLASPAIHEDAGHAVENPVEKAGIHRWSITNPFDPDSEEFFSNAQTELFLEPEELTERQVLISSSVPPSDTDPSLTIPNAGPPITGWVSVGPNMWSRTVRRAHPLPAVPPVPSQMRPLGSPGSSGTSTPRSASPQTPDPVYSPTLPGLIPTEELLARLPPPATTTTITPTTPSLTGTAPRRRQHDSAQADTIPQASPSPPPGIPPRIYNWARSRPEEADMQQSTSRRTRPRLDTGAGASATSSSRYPRRARTRSLGTPHQHLESLIPGYGSWHERHPHVGLRATLTNNGSAADSGNTDNGNRAVTRERVGGLEDDATVALLRRLLERSERARDYVRDLDNHLESVGRRREGLLQDGSRRMELDIIQPEEEPEPEPFIPEPEALSFVAL